MNRLSSFVLGIGAGVVGLYLTMHFTVVRANDGFHFVPKIAAKIEVPYEDVRTFTLAKWQRKQALALSLLRANKGYIMQDQSLLSFKQSSQKMLDQFALVASSKTH